MPKEIAKILIEYMNQENNENEQKNNFIKKWLWIFTDDIEKIVKIYFDVSPEIER
jgi:hypothetical protein